MSELIEFLRTEGVDESLLNAAEDWRTKQAPARDTVAHRVPRPRYPYYGRDVWEEAISALLSGEHLLLVGPKATGKNDLAENLSALFGRPQWDVSFYINTDAASLIGTDTLTGGEVSLRHGGDAGSIHRGDYTRRGEDPRVRERKLRHLREDCKKQCRIKRERPTNMGLEREINNEYPETEMKFSDLLTILKEVTYSQIDAKHLSIFLDFQCQDDFMTQAHYSLMLILKNLVNNAVEAIEFERRKGRIKITGHKAQADYMLSVCDDGPGISEKNLPRVFQHGFSTKFDQTTGNIYRGVGLSGVKSVVEERFHVLHYDLFLCKPFLHFTTSLFVFIIQGLTL